jgi:hypothetical protein
MIRSYPNSLPSWNGFGNKVELVRVSPLFLQSTVRSEYLFATNIVANDT